MKKLVRISSIKPALIIGVGYWKIVYESPPGVDYNIIIPGFRIQINIMEIKDKK